MEGREREPKGPYVFHATKVKHLLERTVELDKHGGNSKGVKAKKVMDLDGSGAYTQDLGTTYLYLANTWEVATSQGYQRVWSGGGEKEGVYFGVLP